MSYPRGVVAQKGGGTLRFVPHADLRVLDVTRYTGYITNRTNAYLVYDTLFSQDEKGQRGGGVKEAG